MPARRALPVAVRLAAAGALLALAGCQSASGSSGADNAVSIKLSQRKAAPNVTGTTMVHGTSFSLAAQRGHVVVMNFWASWCHPCQEEAQALDQAYQDYAPKGVQFIGVDYHGDGADDSAGKAWLSNNGVPYDSLFDKDSRIPLLFKGKVAIEAPPVTVVIDKQGRIADIINGIALYSVLKADLDAATAEPA